MQATALDNIKKSVTLSNGRVLSYDNVLIATGGKWVISAYCMILISIMHLIIQMGSLSISTNTSELTFSSCLSVCLSDCKLVYQSEVVFLQYPSNILLS